MEQLGWLQIGQHGFQDFSHTCKKQELEPYIR